MENHDKIVYPELSYLIVGVMFDVYKELGGDLQEKHYQRALSSEFKNRKIKFSEQVKVPLIYKEQKIGYYALDFLIEDKIAIEIKKDNNFSPRNIRQLYSYLKSLNLKLGILANFTKQGLKFKRVLNIL